MSNSKNNNLEEGSKGTDESAPRANDSTSNKETRFTKSKSISEVFKELEFEDEFEEDSYLDDSSVDEIIPIHNEYMDLESDALDEESIEGGVIINPDLDTLDEADVIESAENEGYEVDSIDDEKGSDEFSESTKSIEDMDDEDSFVVGKNKDDALADETPEKNIGQSSQGVLINKNKSSESEKSLDLFNSSTIITILGFIVGVAILLIGITYYASSSDRVVDNVLSGETAGLAILLVIIGLIIIAFSLLKFFASSKSSFIIDTFNSIKSIDYDEISEDVISRDDFDAIFGMFKRNKDSNFSENGDNDKSVDSKDLNEKDNQDKVSDEDIDSLYSDSNLTSQKNHSSSKEHENANSTESLEDNDDEVDEIIPIHSRLNEQTEESSLEDKYSKYDFEEDSDEDFDLLDDSVVVSDESPVEDFDLLDDSVVDSDESSVEDAPAEEEIVLDDSQDIIEEESEVIESDLDEEIEDDADSSLEVERMNELEDKYSKYDFDDDSDDELEEAPAKPQFKKSVDLSKFDKDALSEEELAEKERKAQELAEKKRRIIEGTNFDNSLRKH